ncbi:MAG: ATP-dependent helicase [Dehalococcoidia bacterium]|nr:ATP-dependent helicase [Dehalococcoidia bacterium]
MEILRACLDEEQLEIASQVDRPMLVLAPPGSGKTHLLTNTVAYRLRSTPDERFRICCLTFSVEAAREMRKRLMDKTLCAPGHRLTVANFHQLGASLLGRWGHLIGWPRNAGMLVPPERDEFIQRLLDEHGSNAKAQNVGTAISNFKGRREGRAGIPAETLRALAQAYEEALVERRLRDFDDLIIHTLQLLREQPRVRAVLRDAYRYVFVDELQDTNQLQLDLIGELVGERCTVFGVADDDQMIYAWRDARPENIAEFVERFGAEERMLRGNYRCPPAVVDAANAVIAVNARRRDELMASRRTDIQGEVILDGANGAEDEAELIVGYIIEELDQGTPAGEIVVLAPHRFMFKNLRPTLEANEIPHVVLGMDDFTKIPTVRAVRGCLNAMAGGTALSDEIRTANQLAGERIFPIASARAAVDAGIGSRPRSLMDALLDALNCGSVRAPLRDAEQVRLLNRMLTQAVAEHEPSNSVELAQLVLMEWSRLEAAASRAEQKVKIMTSFTAKGLEYEVVILPFLNDGIVPYKRRGGAQNWEEARRLFYVAITRAKRRVILTRDTSRADSALLEPLITVVEDVSRTR